MPLDFSIEIDDDVDTSERLVRLALEHVRQIASDDPSQALKGFRIAVCDDDDNLLFEVTVTPRARH